VALNLVPVPTARPPQVLLPRSLRNTEPPVFSRPLSLPFWLRRVFWGDKSTGPADIVGFAVSCCVVCGLTHIVGDSLSLALLAAAFCLFSGFEL